MDNLKIESTLTTPEVNFNASTGQLSLTGSSTIEYPFDFYERLINWVNDYSKNPQKSTTVLVGLEYFNTSSSKCLLNFLKQVILLKEKGELNLKWEYDEEDEDAEDAGHDFSRLLKTPFEMIPVKMD